MIQGQASTFRSIVAITALTVTVFFVDVLTPLGYTVWLLYLVPLMLAVRLSWRQAPLIVCGIDSILTIIGAFVSQPGIPIEYASVNRVLGLSALWVVGGLLTRPDVRNRIGPLGIPPLVFIFIVGTILALAGLVALTFVGASYQIDSTQRVAHAYDVLGVLHQIQVALAEAEVSQHSYLFAQDPTYLGPYAHAVAAIPSLFAQLRTLMGDTLVRQHQLDELERHVGDKLADMKQTIRLFQDENPQVARRLAESRIGSRTIESFRRNVAEIERQEQSILGAHFTQMGQVRSRLLAAIVFGALLQGILLLTVMVLLRRALITQQLEAQLCLVQVLEHSRKQLKSFIENTPAAVAMLDRELRYVHISRRWMEDFHLGDRNIIGEQYYDVFPEIRERREWQEVHQRCLAGVVEGCEEDVFVHANGRTDWLRWEVRPWREENGAIGGIIILAEVITARKQAEEALRLAYKELEERVRVRTAELARTTELLSAENEARKQMEAALRQSNEHLQVANKELEAFSYSVSHDLRGPLRSIDGFSQALLEDCAGKLNDQEKDYLNRVRAASRRMGQLIDDLLHLSCTTRQELQYEPLDLSAMALSSGDQIRKVWPARQVELIVEPGIRARGDRRLLQIVFDNLLDNAWKFTSKRGRATVEVGARPDEGTTTFFIRDNGAGFDRAYADKLFSAFQRLHAVTDYPGTGIGLATVRRIIERHGGRVWGDGRVDEGATFYFTLDG